MNKIEALLLTWAVIIGMPLYGITQLGEYIGWGALLLLIITLAIMGCMGFKSVNKKKRREKLMQKYNDNDLVDLIINKNFWKGQTADQLYDALGKPEDIDRKILKTKNKETWKYNHQGANRYGLRVILDNNKVVRWDQKISGVIQR